MEKPMTSLSGLADFYEKWAKANEATAEELLACLESLPWEVQEQQRRRAGQLVADAAALKIRAKELRDLEGGGMVEIVQDGYKVPQDGNQDRDRSQTIWRYNRFR